MKKSFYSFLLIAFSIFFLTACSTNSSTPLTTPVAPEKSSIIVEGKLAPLNSLSLSFLSSGTVAEVLVGEGDMIQKDQVIAKLESSPPLEAALKRAQQDLLLANQAYALLEKNAQLNLSRSQLAVIQAQDALETAQKNFDEDSSELNGAKLALAQTELDVAKDSLYKLGSKGIDKDQLALVEAQLESAKASLANAEDAISKLELKAPFSGNIVLLNVQTGQVVSAGQQILTLADFSQWQVATDNLTEIDVINIKPEQKVKVIFDALPDLQFDGTVEKINLQAEEKRGDVTYTVLIRLDSSDSHLRWGMTAAVNFER